MLTGDLETMPFPDLLQWADGNRVSGRLVLRQEGGALEARLRDRHLAAVGAPSSSQLQARALSGAGRVPVTAEAQARERFIDAFLDTRGQFTYTHVPDDEPLAATDVALREPLMWLTMEGMRVRDEWPRLAAAFPDARARISATGTPGHEGLHAAASALLWLANDTPTIGEAVPALGLSRPALLRHLDALVQLGLVRVDGAVPGHDPIHRVLRQVESLANEEQYSEALHVIEAMLSVDAWDERLRSMKVAIEERQRGHLLAQLGRSTVLVPRGRPPRDLPDLDAHVLALVDGTRSVEAIVARSALRELLTLKSLLHLKRVGFVRG